MKPLLIAGAALLFSTSALADVCASANTQADMNSCTAQQYQAADKKLNQTYQTVMKRADAAQQPLLKKAQQAWIVLRDADCAFAASGSAGGQRPADDRQSVSGGKNHRARGLSCVLNAV